MGEEFGRGLFPTGAENYGHAGKFAAERQGLSSGSFYSIRLPANLQQEMRFKMGLRQCPAYTSSCSLIIILLTLAHIAPKTKHVPLPT